MTRLGFRALRTAGRTAGLAALPLLLATGCGIRPTSVPVDAGAAPSRVACVLPGGAPTPTGQQFTVVRAYLVCGSRVSPVQRSVRLPEEQVDVAAALLNTLAAEPGPQERAAGFSSRVPDDLEVSGASPADPPGALRLSMPLDALPPAALAQIVCTFAETEAAAESGAVVLAGPADSPSTEPPQRMECTPELRDRDA